MPTLRVVDTPRVMRGEPAKFVVWFAPLFAVLSELPVLGVFVWLDFHGRVQGGPLGPFIYVFAFLAFVTPIVFVILWSQRIVAGGPYFVIDKVAGTLELPRNGVILARKAVQRIIQVRGWKKGGEGKTWTREISVLVTTDDGRLARYLVAFDSSVIGRRRIANTLADAFGVPLTELQQR